MDRIVGMGPTASRQVKALVDEKTSVVEDEATGLDAADNLQELAQALSARIKALEDAT